MRKAFSGFRVLVCLLGMGISTSCSTDVDVNAPYQMRAVVYGLLNSVDTVHYIRVQKAFQNLQEPDALKAAKVKDSIYFPVGEGISVDLFREEPNGLLTRLGAMERVEATGKDSGIFHAPDHVVYRFRGKLIPEDSAQLRNAYGTSSGRTRLTNRRIRLVVTNTNGYQAIARTRLVYPIFDDPFDFSGDPYHLRTPLRYGGTRNFTTVGPHIGFTPNINGAVFKVTVYVPYMEVNRDGTRDTLEVQWNLMSDYFALGNESEIGVDFKDPSRKYEFFEILRQEVDTTKDVSYRRLLPIRIRTISADSALSSYIQISGSYSAITQTRPFFTNVTNGLGLLASRTEKTFQATVDTNQNGEAMRVFNNVSRYRSMRFK